MKKVLIVATVSGFVPQFESNNVRILQSLGYEVHYASNYNTPVYGYDNSRLDNTGIIRHQIDFVRSPYSIINNLKAYRQLKKLMKKEHFDLLHCHTPMGGVIGRLVSKGSQKIKVIYTAHGFHFFKGSPVINWLLYYPIERYLSHFTDVLITINKEDYKNAKRFKLKDSGRVEYINGVGIHTQISTDIMNKTSIYEEFGLKKESFIITSVGELTIRKNHRVIFEAIAKLGNNKITYILCGSGAMENDLKDLARRLNIENQIIFTGYVSNIYNILAITNCFVLPSLQEGLSVALLEAMSAGLAVICSKIRGNTDLIEDGKGGFLVSPTDVVGYVQAIEELINHPSKCSNYGEYNKKIVKSYDIDVVSEKMTNIYFNLDKSL